MSDAPARTRRPKRDVPAITWDQAEVLQLASAQGLQALGFNAATLRYWQSKGYIHPVAKAPGGSLLFHIPTVTEAAKWIDQQKERS